MKEIKMIVNQLKTSDFRPDDWREKIAENTGFSTSQVEKVFYGIRFNKKIALEIIRFFGAEQKQLKKEIEEARQ